jgi:L-fuconolactonase
MKRHAIVDTHVHFWDPRSLHYPWLAGVAALNRPFAPADYATATGQLPIEKVVVVEGNCAPAESAREAEYFGRLADAEPRIAGIVAFADLTTSPGELDRALDVLTASPKVKGIRHNIQGEPPGFCLQPAFVEGARAVGRRGLTFDLCVTHDQLGDVVDLVERCPDTRFVLDHCGKPNIRAQRLEPWSTSLGRLAAHDNVWCKLSGLLTEADPAHWREQDLVCYATRVLECFGTDRVMYGSDWPVLTLAGEYADWYRFTERFSHRWTDAERQRFYCDTAVRTYGL